MIVPRWLTRFYVWSVIAYVALGFVFVGQAYATWERMGAPITTQPVIKVPTGNDDKTVEAYYDYLQLRHLQNQNETYSVQATPLLIVYGVLGGTLFILFTMVWMWYSKRRPDSAGLYPVEVYNGYIAERGGVVEPFTYANYGLMVAFSAWYVWWNIAFGQWM